MWITSVFRLQPCSIAWRAYQRRGQNLLSDPPIEQNQLLIHRRGGADLRCSDTSLEQGQKVLVVLCIEYEINHGQICLNRYSAPTPVAPCIVRTVPSAPASRTHSGCRASVIMNWTVNEKARRPIRLAGGSHLFPAPMSKRESGPLLPLFGVRQTRSHHRDYGAGRLLSF